MNLQQCLLTINIFQKQSDNTTYINYLYHLNHSNRIQKHKLGCNNTKAIILVKIIYRSSSHKLMHYQSVLNVVLWQTSQCNMCLCMHVTGPTFLRERYTLLVCYFCSPMQHSFSNTKDVYVRQTCKFISALFHR